MTPPRSKPDLADLLQRIGSGDRAAFDALYDATSAKLYGLVLGILRRRSLAEEAVQDAFARVWEKAKDYDPAKGSPVTWMAAIARNRALDEIRRAKTAPTVSFPEGFDPAAETEHTLDRMEHSERLKALLACLDGLGPERREAILLAYYRGASREALAARYGRPVPTIKTWIHRGLIQLRGCLSQ